MFVAKNINDKTTEEIVANKEKEVWMEWFKSGKIDSDVGITTIKCGPLKEEFEYEVKKRLG